MDAEVVLAHPQAIERAAEIIRSGGLVAFPTETVYGLGADATNGLAVARIFEAKGRPSFNPLIVHVLDVEAAARISTLSPLAERLAEAFWPGPLTLVLPRRDDNGVSELVSAGLSTIAVRAPDHPIARRLLTATGLPVAAPSANRSGRVSATTAEHVATDLAGRINLILDGGPAAYGLESTVVSLAGDLPMLLRPGAVPAAAIEAMIGAPLMRMTDAESSPASPGQLESHYAPRAKLRLNAVSWTADEAALMFGATNAAVGQIGLNLSPAGDLLEAAANLFAAMRLLDQSGAATIAVAPIPDEGLGEAINDRLRRAAAPRP